MVPNLKSGRSAQAQKKLLRSASCHGTSKTAPNRQLNKKKLGDLKPHMLMFEEGGLVDGTELTYKKEAPLQKGYKAASKIFCYCCRQKISPSKFEEHAGKGSHKKPYSYIQLENGVSLHRVALYLRDNEKSSADSEKGLLCDECRSCLHKDSASLPMNTPAKWQCGLCGRENIEQNSNASEARRVAEIDECTTCVVRKNEETNFLCGHALCSVNKYCDCQFGPLALIACVQCEKQFHVCCLKEHGKSDLKAKPKGKWFCSFDCDSECEKIFSTLQSFIEDGGEEKIRAFSMEDLRMDIRSLNISNKDVRWRLLCAKSSYSDDKLLSDATSIFYENFGGEEISEPSADFIRSMVYGKKGQNSRMYCAVVTVKSKVVAAGLFRVLGQDLAELPLAATAMANRRKGYFRLLIFYLEKLLTLLNVRLLVLPATKESIPIWKENFGFQNMSSQQEKSYRDICWDMTTFLDADMLHKVIAKESNEDMEE